MSFSNNYHFRKANKIKERAGQEEREEVVDEDVVEEKEEPLRNVKEKNHPMKTKRSRLIRSLQVMVKKK